MDPTHGQSIREVPLSFDSFVDAHIKKNYGDSMSPSQLQVLLMRTFEALKTLPREERKEIKASWKGKEPESAASSIDKLIREKLIKSPTSPWKPTVEFEPGSRKELIFNTLRGKFPNLGQLANHGDLLFSVLWEQDDEVFNEARSVIQDIFTDMHRQLSSDGQLPYSIGGLLLSKMHIPPSEKDSKLIALFEAYHFHMEMIIGELLSLYPFLAPVDEDTLNIPTLIASEWQLIEYTVDKIELTPPLLGSPIVAIGLHSDNSEAPGRLLFKGTTYFADEGAFLSILTDINPFGSVGRYAFAAGKSKIEGWLDEHSKDDNKAIVYGKSLGGAQAWRSAIHFPDKIGKVMAYGAPGFFPDERNLLRKLATPSEGKVKLPESNFFCQAGDAVPYCDLSSDQGIHYYEVLGGKTKGNPIAAHADVYATHEQSAILKMEPSTISSGWRRAVVTVTRLACMAFFWPLLYLYLIKTCCMHLPHLFQRGPPQFGIRAWSCEPHNNS